MSCLTQDLRKEIRERVSNSISQNPSVTTLIIIEVILWVGTLAYISIALGCHRYLQARIKNSVERRQRFRGDGVLLPDTGPA
ncbi:alpha 1 protein [Fox fecal rhabdovirus]|uniref:Alpha 1 protein n=1 Tax=Fox fecal rhabdovirus TaxID=1504569 RepID=A0A060D558_9RHAB|nr:alpha 1 protein [Fox fecal rhabdovirus]AIB06809.1 alpha 1 protein [Fox fecal rhabdovirus]